MCEREGAQESVIEVAARTSLHGSLNPAEIADRSPSASSSKSSSSSSLSVGAGSSTSAGDFSAISGGHGAMDSATGRDERAPKKYPVPREASDSTTARVTVANGRRVVKGVGIKRMRERRTVRPASPRHPQQLETTVRIEAVVG